MHEPRVGCGGEVFVGVHGEVDLVRRERVAQRETNTPTPSVAIGADERSPEVLT